MGKDSKIQWTDNTWNPWHGCKKVSDGCKYCYMFRDKDRYGQVPTNVLRSKSNFNDPLKWIEPQLIFTCSWSDFFIEEADPWRAEAWEIIKNTPHHTYQILTKRPERIKECLPDDWDRGYKNVWLGVSIENQLKMPQRLMEISIIPAKVRFLSMEPLLGPISFSYSHIASDLFLHKIDWVIIGGESGNDTGKYLYRECHASWILDLIKTCKTAAIPVFVKQHGTYISKKLGWKDRHGGDMREWPKGLQIRQMPYCYKPNRKL